MLSFPSFCVFRVHISHTMHNNSLCIRPRYVEMVIMVFTEMIATREEGVKIKIKKNKNNKNLQPIIMKKYRQFFS